MPSNFLSFDLGASSGRAVVTQLHDQTILTDEIFRFENHPVMENNRLVWDFSLLFANIEKGLKLAYAKYPDIISIGIDTWGVDYGLLDSNGKLIRNPLCYRDANMTKRAEEILKILPQSTLYKKTGIQHMVFNTIFQLAADFRENLDSKKAETFLMMPDLIAYYLTGVKKMELTNLSTTNFYDPVNKSIIADIETLGIPKRIFPDTILPGSTYGFIKEELANKLNIPRGRVVAVCSHDTASAVLAIKMSRSSAFISSGTWSLCGTVLSKPVVNTAAYESNFTNEVGYLHSIRFLKNVMGLWILNQCRETWEQEGNPLSFSEIEKIAMKTRPFVSFIDPDDVLFVAPGNMPERIKEYCQKTNQIVPNTPGEIIRCVYQSLALKYRMVINNIEVVTKHKIRKIVIVGGGTQIDLLSQMTASATNKKVEIGMKEATIAGNALILMQQSGVIESIDDGRNLYINQKTKKTFLPLQTDDYDEAYVQFKKIMEENK